MAVSKSIAFRSQECPAAASIYGNAAMASTFPFHVPNADGQIWKERTMRNILLAGSAGLLIALSAAGVAKANNPNVPIWSPYSLNTNVGEPVRHHWHRAGMTEGRAAATTDTQTQIFSDGSSDQNFMGPNATAPSSGPSLPAGQPMDPADR
jgi:hypothetical protein